MSQLIIERGPGKGQRIEIMVFPATLGRDPKNSIILEDEEASRFHLKIKRRGRLYILEDLDSKNGTYINGDRVVNSIVQNGDKILVGSTELLFATNAANIEFAKEILKFDMLVGEEFGINGPINIGSKHDQEAPTPFRLKELATSNKIDSDPAGIKQIYDIAGNILTADNLTEASNQLLKAVGQIGLSFSRAAFFVWQEESHQLIPIASRHYGKQKHPFILSQRSFEDALNRKQGILLQHNAVHVTHSTGKDRIILPMRHNDITIGLIHIESDANHQVVSPIEISKLQAIINHTAPIFESLTLRQEIDSLMLGVVETMIATIEAKDTYTVGHSERVCRYSMAIAEELKLNHDVKKQLMISSLCHDIGKIGIPDSILKKASLLSADEYEEMKLHPTIGADIISHMPNAKRFISGVKYHHEKWDGTGYPEGLVGEDIPFFGRIVAVADVFDALVSGRSYSGFIDESDAVQKITEEEELFDSEIVKALTKAWDNDRLTQKTSTQNQRMSQDTASHDMSENTANNMTPQSSSDKKQEPSK